MKLVLDHKGSSQNLSFDRFDPMVSKLLQGTVLGGEKTAVTPQRPTMLFASSSARGRLWALSLVALVVVLLRRATVPTDWVTTDQSVELKMAIFIGAAHLINL